MAHTLIAALKDAQVAALLKQFFVPENKSSPGTVYSDVVPATSLLRNEI